MVCPWGRSALVQYPVLHVASRAVDAANPALGFEPGLITLGTIGRVGPDVRRSVVGRHHFAQLGAVMACTVGHHRLADEAKALIDSDVVFVAKTGDSNVYLRFAIRSRGRRRPRRLRALAMPPA